MILSKIIQRLRLNSFFLFILPTLAIIGSLLIHNFLVDFKYQKSIKFKKYLTDIPGQEYTINCTEDNNFCFKKDIFYFLNEKSPKIGDCFVHTVKVQFYVTGENNIKTDDIWKVYNKENDIWTIRKQYLNSNIKQIRSVKNEKDIRCIKNYPSQFFFYKYFLPYSFILNQTANLLEKKLNLGSSVKINPFLYGEISISNLVKRHPINYFFKSFMYLGIILMFTYWYNYNKIIKTIIDKKTNFFYFFGIASAVFLFFHVLFLGTNSNNEILKDFRKIILVLFILFEVLAQTFLAIKIFSNKNIFMKYSHSFIVMAKIIFISTVLSISIILILLLIFYNFPSNIDNILEWNYFIILLIFYLLSSFMWKKKINF